MLTSPGDLHFRTPVFEMKVSYCANAGCMGSQNCALGYLSMCSSLHKGINILETACTHWVHR